MVLQARRLYGSAKNTSQIPLQGLKRATGHCQNPSEGGGGDAPPAEKVVRKHQVARVAAEIAPQGCSTKSHILLRKQAPE